jgi:hypothetical protein
MLIFWPRSFLDWSEETVILLVVVAMAAEKQVYRNALLKAPALAGRCKKVGCAMGEKNVLECNPIYADAMLYPGFSP